MKGKLKPIIIAVILVALIGSYYYYLTTRNKDKEEVLAATAVQNVLMKNLEKDYPPTPKEVVKYYSEITKCLYNETYSDEEYEKMADAMLTLYDDELAARNPRDIYLKSLKNDIDLFEQQQYTIVSFTPSTSTDVEKSVINGRECAKLYCTYTIKEGATAKTKSSREVFELRKDTAGHWKILGFKIDDMQ